MTIDELIGLDRRVRKGLGVRQDQSIEDRAIEIVGWADDPAKRCAIDLIYGWRGGFVLDHAVIEAARYILADNGAKEPWERMAKVAEMFNPKAVEPPAPIETPGSLLLKVALESTCCDHPPISLDRSLARADSGRPVVWCCACGSLSVDGRAFERTYFTSQLIEAIRGLTKSAT
jgi:hypothetical protein